LRSFLLGLPPEMLYELLLVMHLGRGDFTTNDLDENREKLKNTFYTRKLASSQMILKSALASYLADGLEKLKKNGFNANRLFSKPSPSRK